MVVCLYIDDQIYTRNDRAMRKKSKMSMMAEFDMTNLGKMCYFLGIEIVQFDAATFISQKKYVNEVLHKI